MGRQFELHDPLIATQLTYCRRFPRSIVKLHLAILSQTLDLIRKHPHKSGLRAEALAWIASDADDHPFAFRITCDVLELSPTLIRRLLARGVRPTIRFEMVDGPAPPTTEDAPVLKIAVVG